MKRRNFLLTTLTTSALAGVSPLTTGQAKKSAPREYYEVRVYQLKSTEKQALVENYLQNALLPAYNRMGVKTVGVFKDIKNAENLSVYVLIPYQSIEQFFQNAAKLSSDAAYQKAAETYFNVPMSDPAYERMESWFMLAFEDIPKLELPAKKERIFELRIYESHTEKAGKQKVKMFNAGGEIPIFRKTGLKPVFFGETLIGPRLPNLTYMLTFDSIEQRDANWKVFSANPDWIQLKDLPEYKDTVSKVTSILMAPTAYSQV